MMIPAMADETTARSALLGSATFAAHLEAALDPGYRLATVMLRDYAAAQDAVQEASLKAWRKYGQLRSPAGFRTWFLSIVANECRMMVRGRWWHVLRMAEPPPPSPELEQALAGRE